MSLIACLLTFLFVSAAFVAAEQTRITDTHNVYGGKTEEEIYSKGNDVYEEGLSRKVEFYDGNNRMRRMESYYTEENSKKDGVFKREQYYENKRFEKAELAKTEFYYTDEFADQNGIFKAEHYYKDEKKEKTEFCFTDAHAKKKLVSRLEIYFNSGGDETRRVYYDKSGSILSSDEGSK